MIRYFMTKTLFVVTILLCSIGIACPSSDSASREKAQQIWLRNESVVESVVKHEKIDPNRLWPAVLFLQQVSGIAVPGEFSTVIDFYPTAETAKAIRPLRAWYAANKDRLYFDEETQSVKLKPPA